MEPFKSRAKALHEDWERAIVALQSTPSLESAKQIVNVPTRNLGDFKAEVLARQRGGEWLGWLFPLFVEHTLHELMYFVARVWNGGLSPEVTFCQNITFMREHAEFAAHLLDPSATSLIRHAEGLGTEFAACKGGCHALTPDLINLGRKAGEQLDEYFRTQPVSAASGKSVIHPVLAEHVIREGQRFLETMNELSTR